MRVALLCLLFAPPLHAQCERAVVPLDSRNPPSTVVVEGERALLAMPGVPWGTGPRLLALAGGPGGWSVEQVLPLSDDVYLLGEDLAAHGRHAALLGLTQGAVWMYERLAGGWTLAQVLTVPLTPTDVALDGDWLAVGLPFNSPYGVVQAGEVFLFELVAGTWKKRGGLIANVPRVGGWFGADVALSGDVLWVGEPGDQFAQEPGVAHAFERHGDSWVATSRVAGRHGFSGLLDTDGSRAIAATPGVEEAPRVFERSADGWEETGALDVGWRPVAMALDGDSAVVVSRNLELDHAVEVHRLVDSRWACVDRFPLRKGVFWRVHVALDGENALVSHHGKLTEPLPGLAGLHSFVLSRAGAPFCAGGPCPCGNEVPGVDGCRNSTGVGARLDACGSASVAADDLVLDAHGLPPMESAGVLMGVASAGAPFGDGRLCLAGPPGPFRFPLRGTGAAGAFREGPGLVAHSAASFPPAGSILAGATWGFQAWYRDAASPCGSGFNLSNALAVTFTL